MAPSYRRRPLYKSLLSGKEEITYGYQNGRPAYTQNQAATETGADSLMKEKSVKDITVRELSELCDINRGTFYAHYANVFDMVDKIESEMVAHLNNALDACCLENPNMRLLPLLEEIFSFVAEYADMVPCSARAKTAISHFWTSLKTSYGKNASLNGGSQYPAIRRRPSIMRTLMPSPAAQGFSNSGWNAACAKVRRKWPLLPTI